MPEIVLPLWNRGKKVGPFASELQFVHSMYIADVVLYTGALGHLKEEEEEEEEEEEGGGGGGGEGGGEEEEEEATPRE